MKSDSRKLFFGKALAIVEIPDGESVSLTASSVIGNSSINIVAPADTVIDEQDEYGGQPVPEEEKTKVAAPDVKVLTYNGKTQAAFTSGSEYIVTNGSNKDAGAYTATLILKD